MKKLPCKRRANDIFTQFSRQICSLMVEYTSSDEDLVRAKCAMAPATKSITCHRQDFI